MKTYSELLLFIIPVFLLSVITEKWYGLVKNRDPLNGMDMISSLSSGITNIIKDVLGFSISIITYEWMVNRMTIYPVKSGFLAYVIAFLVMDFSGYWIHRIQHKINLFWNGHVIHHSSEEFNLACALRQSISGFVQLFTFLMLPAALLGVPAGIIAIVGPIHLFAQFWYHTTYIGKMGFLEKIIVTPSHHRVHHAMNSCYMDKNFGQIFILWDKLFGTFQEEIKGTPPVYGITRPARTWNPIKINFQHAWLMIKDAWHTRNWADKLKIWFMPTGWRPADVEEKYKIYKVEDVYNFRRYAPASPNIFIGWSLFQMLVTITLGLYMLVCIADIPHPYIFIYGFFLLLSVYAYTELMDGNKNTIYWEAGKNLVGLTLILQAGGSWFGLHNQFINYLLILYFIMATIITGLLTKRKFVQQPVLYEN